MATLMEQFGKLMVQLKGVITKDSGQDVWCERINLISQAVAVMGEDYVTQLKDGGIVDQKMETSQVNTKVQVNDVDGRVNSLEGDAASKGFRIQTIEGKYSQWNPISRRSVRQRSVLQEAEQTDRFWTARS